MRIVICILMLVPDLSLSALIALFFLMGLVTSSQVLTYPMVAELNPTYLTSTSLSIISLCIMGSGFIIPAVFGWLMQWGVMHHVMDYSASDFNRAMLMIPFSFAIGLLLTFFMRETGCQLLAEEV